MIWKTKKMTLSVEGMSCEHCEQTVEKGLTELDGVTKAKASHSASRVVVSYGGSPPDRNLLFEKIQSLGYEVVDV